MLSLRQRFLSYLFKKELNAFHLAYVLLGCFLFHYFLSCKPVEENSPTLQYRAVGGGIAQLHFTNNTLAFGVGGREWKNGFTLFSPDDGATWVEHKVADSKVNCLIHCTDGWVRALGLGSELHQFNHNDYRLLKTPQPRTYRGVAQVDSNRLLAVGGEAFQHGFVEEIQLLPFHTKVILDKVNELNDVLAIAKDKFIAIGFGVVLIIDMANSSIERLPIEGDHFIDISSVENTSFILGISGTVWRLDHQTLSYKMIRKDGIIGRPVLFRCIFFKNRSEGMIAGDQGTAYKTNDAGKNWIKLSIVPNESIQCISYHLGKYWLGTSAGSIYTIE